MILPQNPRVLIATKPVDFRKGSHRRPRLGCLAGTFSPSCLQIRSTRLSLTTQPAPVRSSSATLR